MDEPLLHALPSPAQVRQWRRMTPGEKLELLFGLNQLADELAEAGRKARLAAG